MKPKRTRRMTGMENIKCINNCTFDIGTTQYPKSISFKKDVVYSCEEYYCQLVVNNEDDTASIAFSMPFENNHLLNNFEYVMNMGFLKSFERRSTTPIQKKRINCCY